MTSQQEREGVFEVLAVDPQMTGHKATHRQGRRRQGKETSGCAIQLLVPDTCHT